MTSANGLRPPHPVLLPEGRRNARTSRSETSAVLAPLGVRGGAREDFKQIAPYLDAFRARSGAIEPPWLIARRDAGMKRFGETGFPTRKQEIWRFTDLRPLTAAPILPGTALASFDPSRLEPYYFGGASHRIVLINGRFAPELSNIGHLPDGVLLCSTAEALNMRPALAEIAFDASDSAGAQPFASLNAAFFSGGFVLALDPGAVLETPVEIVHFGDAPEPGAFHLRNIVSAGAGSSATLIETFAGAGAGWTNAVTAVHLGGEAAIRHVKIQDEAADAIHLSLTRGTLAKSARYETFILSLGARLSATTFTSQQQEKQPMLPSTAPTSCAAIRRLRSRPSWITRRLDVKPPRCSRA